MIQKDREKEPMRDEFDRALLEAVDEGLLIIGDGVGHVIYHHVERSFNVRREEIPEKLDLFQKGLEALLGVGARVPEKLIARKLYDKLGVSFEEHEGWTLVDYVNRARSTS